jgi:tRNA(Ile2) C34 agmatinyltransferase TiaS
VSQSWAQLQRLALSGACGQNMRGDLVAGEYECRHCYYRYEETLSMLRAEVLRRSTLACGLASPARASLHLSNFFAGP